MSSKKAKIPLCPNCKSTVFDIKWVRRYKKDKNTSSFKEVAKDKLEEVKREYEYSGSLIPIIEDTISPFTSTFSTIYTTTSFMTTTMEYALESLAKRYIQLVLKCKYCGFTVTINIDEWRLAHEL